MSHTVLIATEKPFAPVAVEQIGSIFKKAGYTVKLLEKYPDKAALLAALPGVEALIVRSDGVDAEVLAAAPDLKIVVRAGAGTDNVDGATAKSRGVVVMNTPGQNANAVAELALGMMVYQCRNQFNGSSGTELLGKTLGIHAFGAVGRAVARIARGFGMTVLAHDPFVPAEALKEAGVEPVEAVEDLYRRSNYLSLHIPTTPETKGSIGRRLLSLLPKKAVLVNTARKEVIHEEELLALMQERSDLAYVSDLAPANAAALREACPGRVFFTPKKMGAQTSEANVNAGLAAARQIVAFFEEGDVRFQVNR